MSPVLSVVRPDGSISREEVADLVARACPVESYRGRKVLLIVPDATRTAPVDVFFQALHARIGAGCARFDVMVALGTHPPMPDAAICARLGISSEERRGPYAAVRLLNHHWQDPETLTSLGTIPAAEIDALSGGRFALDVPVRINLGYRDPATIQPADYANREDEGVLLVPKAGEMLFQLREPAAWARGVAASA